MIDLTEEMMDVLGATIRKIQNIDNIDEGIEKCSQPSANHHENTNCRAHEN